MRHCRVCDRLLERCLLELNSMPASAQSLPTREALDTDQSLDLGVYQCEACGLVQLDCEPVSYYREVIRATAYSPEMKTFRLSQLEAFVNTHGLKGKKVLEIGCGRGEYLGLLQESGLLPVGTEYGAANIAAAREAGYQVESMFPDAQAQGLEGSPFAAFFTFNFMEHWPDPRTVLIHVGKQLAEDSVGLVEVPNFDMLYEKKISTEFIADHLSYFTTQSLRTLLELSGFDVLEIREIWYRYILSATVRKRKTLNFEPFKDTLAQQKLKLSHFIEKAGHAGVAIWGAGHQALAAIALMGLAEHVRYVIDSAPFKQGRYTPASKLPIVAPETLETDPVSSIIIMAAGFSDEVARQIKQRWGDRFSLAILREDHVEEVPS